MQTIKYDDQGRKVNKWVWDDCELSPLDLANGMDAEERRAVEEGLSEAQLALFDLLQRGDLSNADRERIKQASRELLAGVLAVIAPLDRWTEKEQTQAEVQTFILDQIYRELPEPPYTPEENRTWPHG